VGEFRQMGFSMECRFRPGLSPGEFDQFTDDFIEHCVKAHGLLFGGGGSLERGWDGVVSRDHRYDSTTETDKAVVESWLQGRSEVVSCRLSGFWDVWHGPDPFDPSIAAAGTRRAGVQLTAS
jgi:uncharacterized protein YggL (DUF469 family)